MLLGRQVFENMSIDPDNYLCVNFATTGIQPPIGIIEFAGRLGEAEHNFQYFLAPEDMMIGSDLNYAYTKIDRYKYDRNIIDTQDFLNEFVSFLRERPVSIVIINNEWWFRRIMKDKANRLLSPLFSALGRVPVFPLSYYETARVAYDYTLFSPSFEFCGDLIEHIKRLKKQAPKEYAYAIEDSYEIRGGEEIDDTNLTASQLNVLKMDYVWNNILNNTEYEEVYRKP